MTHANSVSVQCRIMFAVLGRLLVMIGVNANNFGRGGAELRSCTQAWKGGCVVSSQQG